MAGTSHAPAVPVLEDRSGEAGIPQPASAGLTLTLVSAAFFGSLIVLIAGLNSDVERFPGTLSAETTRLVAPTDGVVDLVDVQSGQVVLPGRELFVVVDETLDREIQAAEAQVNALQTSLDRATARANVELQKHSRETDREIFETEIVLTELIRSKYRYQFEETAWSCSPNYFDALASNSIPQVDLRSLAIPPEVAAENSRLRSIIEKGGLENDQETIAARIELCETRIQELHTGREKLKEVILAANGVPRLNEELEAATATLERLRSREAVLTVRSPVYGMAGLVSVTEQDVVQEGTVLLDIFDRDAEYVDVQLPSRLVPHIRPAQRVAVHFPGDESREGQIQAIPPQLEPAVHGEADAHLSIRVTAVGRAWPTLPIGTRVSISLLSE